MLCPDEMLKLTLNHGLKIILMKPDELMEFLFEAFYKTILHSYRDPFLQQEYPRRYSSAKQYLGKLTLLQKRRCQSFD